MTSAFGEKVYEVVRKIPKGSVLTYQEVARRAGNPRAARAVGNLMAKNPNWPKVPCHRVVRSDGTIGGWSGPAGKKQKARLLQREGHLIVKLKIQNAKFKTTRQNSKF